MGGIEFVVPLHWHARCQTPSRTCIRYLLGIIQLACVVTVCAAQGADAVGAQMQYAGVNIAGGEFAPGKLPGVYDRDYTYPHPA